MTGSLKETRLNIEGMTCVNCERRIEVALASTDGVAQVAVSCARACAEVTYDPAVVSCEELTRLVEELGYQVVDGSRAARARCMRTACLLALIIALYMLLQCLNLLNLLVPGQLAQTGMGYGMLFAVGLLTSVHCVAMCGGINLTQCIPRADADASTTTGRRPALGPAVAYNAGRVLSYTVIGLVLGSVGLLLGGGSATGLSTFLQGVLKMLAGVVMVAMGLGMLGILPPLSLPTPRLPRAVLVARGSGRGGTAAARPFAVGLLNGLMPCGPLQSMWVVALASGSPLAGALSMLLFGLGTVPLMLGLGGLVAALGRAFERRVMTVGAVLVAILGLAMLSQGGLLSGLITPRLLLALAVVLALCVVLVRLPWRTRRSRGFALIAAALLVVGVCTAGMLRGGTTPGSALAGTDATLVDGVQVVSSTLESGQYPSITVQAGTPVRWVIDAPEGSVNGCNYRMLIDAYGIEYEFHTGENVIEFTPTEAGTVSFSCWMGMIWGQITVTEEES